MNKTNKTHWRLFKREFSHWGEVFGFNRYDILHEWTDEKTGALAYVMTQKDPTNFVVVFCKHWEDTPVDDHEVAKVAFHEALEIVFDPIEGLAPPRHKKRAEEEKHKLINLLTTLLFKPYWKKR